MRSSLLRNPGYWICVALLGGSAAGLASALDAFKITLKKEPINAPGDRMVRDIPGDDLPSFTRLGEDRKEKAEIEETLGTTNYVSRTYVLRKDKGHESEPVKRLEFHAAYYTGMIDTVPHVPERCFVGGGMLTDAILGDIALPLRTEEWRAHQDPAFSDRYKSFRIPNSSRNGGAYVTLPRDPEGIRLHTTRFLGPGGVIVHAGYFFIANGGWVSTADDVRLLAFDRRSKYAYYLKIQFSSDSVKSGEELAALGAKFLDESFGEILLAAPDWVKVEKGEYPPADSLNGPSGGLGSSKTLSEKSNEANRLKVDNRELPTNK